jgi:hypothetical protein
LIIELFSQQELNKIEIENCIGIWGVFFESPWRVRFSRFYFTIFRAKEWRIFYFGLEWILSLESQTKLQKKLGLEAKIH